MKKMLISFLAIVLVAAMSPYYDMATAQTYPTKPIRLIVPYPPGGGVDIVGRLIASRLSERLGKQIIVENRGGAGSVIGTEVVARSEPDGYTLLIISSAYTINPSLLKLPYDPVKSFVPVAKLLSAVGVLAVHPSVPAKSVKELIALAKEKPGKLVFVSVGVGTFHHLACELFKSMAGIDFMIVQFSGGGPAMTDLLGGHSQGTINTPMSILSYIHAGKLRALGTGGLKRSFFLPQVPTISEAGVPGYSAANWFGMLAPAGTPKPIVDRLNKELSTILNSAEAQKQFHDQGMEADHVGLAEFGHFMAAETAQWARVIKEGNIKPE